MTRVLTQLALGLETGSRSIITPDLAVRPMSASRCRQSVDVPLTRYVTSKALL